MSQIDLAAIISIPQLTISAIAKDKVHLGVEIPQALAQSTELSSCCFGFPRLECRAKICHLILFSSLEIEI